MKNWSSRIGGADPGSAADAPVGLLAPRKMLMSLCRLRDEGIRPQRGPQDQGVRPTRPRGCGFSTLSFFARLEILGQARRPVLRDGRYHEGPLMNWNRRESPAAPPPLIAPALRGAEPGAPWQRKTRR